MWFLAVLGGSALGLLLGAVIVAVLLTMMLTIDPDSFGP